MADNLSDIVQITITKETTAIDTASFNIPLILATTVAFPERTRTYSSIGAVAEDFGATSEVYQVASKLMGGGVRPTYIIVGRQRVSSATYLVSPTQEGTLSSITINGAVFFYEAASGDSGVEIAQGLVASFNDEPLSNITLVNNGDALTIENEDEDENLFVESSGNIDATQVLSDENWGDTIAAVEEENSVWYGVVATTHDPADVLEIAQAIQARSKIFGTSTQDPESLTTGDADIGAVLASLNYDKTYSLYTPYADEDYPEAVWMGGQMPLTPGSNTWAFKQAPGVRAANLTETQKTNLRNKHMNMVTSRAGVTIFEDGQMVDGTWIDEAVFIHWWVARVQEAVFFRLINSRKVPMTRAGASIIETEIRSVNALGVANGGIADDSPITVTAPDPLRIPANMRAQRILGDFRVRFRLAGAVHKVIVDAVVGI